MKKHKYNLIKVAILTLGISGVFGASSAGASTTYEIKKGDTLYSLAKKHELTVAQLKQLNNLSSSTIYLGDKLTIPTTITIKKGDTLYSLAKKYNTSVSQLKFINHLTSNTIIVGKKLVIPTNVTVKAGDTLYSIAKNYGLTVSELKSINYLTSNWIKVGQTLNVAYAKKDASSPNSYDASKKEVNVRPTKGFTFDAEEPRKFILQSTSKEEYFSRLEVLDSNVNLEEIKTNSMMYLNGNKVTEHDPKATSHPFYHDALLYLHGYNNNTQTTIVVKEINGVFIRFTIHYLNKEESEAIIPKMIKILQTTSVK
ncbi:LysM peptidoglycan-binding domain-containing protein [Metabacillus endolithicus]|uniref:LysM peptidoglycan-binding domain-containing protein n=1 Tax=Metabacillus endolithicus TaxID=1535204 RepID=A0ABW5C3H8_9BACI|nr:LysM peptidoglycan-binding domain-containing protein [Metabacillus endolithicus]UPG64968.1 LysM peptidoglycan-binding domain-containing protein [Metabacillus endolithicus]